MRRLNMTLTPYSNTKRPRPIVWFVCHYQTAVQLEEYKGVFLSYELSEAIAYASNKMIPLTIIIYHC